MYEELFDEYINPVLKELDRIDDTNDTNYGEVTVFNFFTLEGSHLILNFYEPQGFSCSSSDKPLIVARNIADMFDDE